MTTPPFHQPRSTEESRTDEGSELSTNQLAHLITDGQYELLEQIPSEQADEVVKRLRKQLRSQTSHFVAICGTLDPCIMSNPGNDYE